MRALHKTWYGFYQYPKYRSHSRETSQNASHFHNFSKLEPVPQPKLRIQSYMSILQTKYRWRPNPSEVRNWKTHKKISHYKITMLYDSIHKLLQKFIHKNLVYYQGSFMTSPKSSLSPNSKLIFTTCYFLIYHRNNIFCSSSFFPFSFFPPWFIVPKHSSKLYQLICKIHWTLPLISNFLLLLFNFYWTRLLKPWKTDTTDFFIISEILSTWARKFKDTQKEKITFLNLSNHPT